jgi:RNA polymerase sigma-70 factor (ECF subfamily)
VHSLSTSEPAVTADVERAVHRLFVEHGAAIHRYAARRVGTDLADDVVAETFRRAFESIGSFDPARGSHRAWLFGIATNVLRKHRRSEARRLRALVRAQSRTEPPPDPLLARAVSLDAERELARVLDAIDLLPADDVDLLVLVAWERMSRAEVAAILGIPAGTVRSRLHRIRTVLDRARLGGEGSQS